MSLGAARITAERAAHMTREGWTPEHDARHRGGEMTLAGIAYAEHAAKWLHLWGEFSGWDERQQAEYAKAEPPLCWPWGEAWWKPKYPIRDLERAGALIAAEIDRAAYFDRTEAEGLRLAAGGM